MNEKEAKNCIYEIINKINEIINTQCVTSDSIRVIFSEKLYYDIIKLGGRNNYLVERVDKVNGGFKITFAGVKVSVDYEMKRGYVVCVEYK